MIDNPYYSSAVHHDFELIAVGRLELEEGGAIPELKLGKEHDVAVVIAKHGKEEAEEAPAESAEVPASKVAKKDDK